MPDLLIHPQTQPLKGTITVPGDKSISHRAVLLAAIAEGTSTIRNWLPAGDTLATLAIVQQLGVAVEVDRHSPQAWDLRVEGRGLHGLEPAAAGLDCRNAGTCIRLLAGIMAGQRFASILDGSEQLRQRPMGRIVSPLRQMGAAIAAENGRCPLHIQPAPLQGIRFEMNVASAQVKSAILLAGLFAGETHVYQPGPARDHTERMLAAMGVSIIAGIPVTAGGNWLTLPDAPAGGWHLQPLDLTVPGDISSAAFPLVAALLVPHSEIHIKNVGLNETRTGLLAMLAGMGAHFQIHNRRTTGGEPVGDLRVTFEELHATGVGGETVVRGIDELPVWAVAATQAAGRSSVCDAAELRVKEVDRISMLAAELRRLGVTIVEQDDGFTVTGPSHLSGTEVDSHGDHRLGMALAVAGLRGSGGTRVHDAACVADSFPAFVETMQALGADIQWEGRV